MESTWKEILERIQLIKRKAVESGIEVWFRGQRYAEWGLISSLHRYMLEMFNAGKHNGALTNTEKVTHLWEEYKSQFYQFQNLAWGLLAPQEQQDWGIIFSMQHHGIPTILMDWTDNFPCALYFSNYERHKTEDAAIYALFPDELNKATIGSEGLIAINPWFQGNKNNNLINTDLYLPNIVADRGNLCPIAISPPSTNQRIKAQSGRFILCGNSFSSLEELYPQCITKIILPSAIFDDVQSFLDLIGIRHFNYFPDLHGLTENFKQKRKWTLENI